MDFKLTKYEGSDFAGIHGGYFAACFDTNDIRYMDTIYPKYLIGHCLKVQSNGKKVDDGYEYDVQYMTNDPHKYFPPQYLKKDTVYTDESLYKPQE